MPSTTTARPDKPESTVMAEDTKDSFSSHTLSKFDYDLYKEDDDIKLPVIRVKYVELPHNGARWKIFEDAKVVFLIEGSKLNNKEKDFLRTIDGVNFLIAQFKCGIKSFNALKKEIKKKVK